MNEIGNGILWYLGFLVSVTCHEAAHAWAALKGGDPTAYEGGQVSFDPEPHMRRSPIGMIALPLISIFTVGWPIGFASSPYNLAWAERHPRRAAWMALAGPAANLALVLLTGLVFWLGEAGGVFARSASPGFDHVVGALDSGIWPAVAHILSILFSMNLILFAFNMLPIPPLDGASAVGVLFADETARRLQHWMRKPVLSIVGLVLAWNYFGPVVQHLFAFALNVLFPGSGYAPG